MDCGHSGIIVGYSGKFTCATLGVLVACLVIQYSSTVLPLLSGGKCGVGLAYRKLFGVFALVPIQGSMIRAVFRLAI